MRKYFVMALLLSFGAAWAWGPGAHFYFASKILRTGHLDAGFAAMLPDCNVLASTPAIKSRMVYLGHRAWWHLPVSECSIGFSTHNGDWGADFYAHSFFDPSIPPSYMARKMQEFADIVHIPMWSCEDVFEGMFDYLLRRDLGPQFGRDIEAGASQITPFLPVFVNAYAQPLADGVPGMSIEEARAELTRMFTQFQLVGRTYGIQLALNDMTFIRQTLVNVLKELLSVDQPTAEYYCTMVEEMCSDYRPELDAIAAEIRGNSPHQMPVSKASAALAALLVAGLARRSRRILAMLRA